jgi:hypothetical protein
MRDADLPPAKKDTEVDRVQLSVAAPPEQKPDPAPSNEVEGDAVKAEEKAEEEVVKLKISPERVDFGKAINVEWEHSAEPTVRDWIALYAEGKSGREYVTFEWVSQRKGRE